MYCLLEVVAVDREAVAPKFVTNLGWIKVTTSFSFIWWMKNVFILIFWCHVSREQSHHYEVMLNRQ